MSTWESFVRRVEPYTPGEQPSDAEMIKLNTNENPYPPSPAVQEALRRAADEAADQRLYPDPTAGQLVQAIAGALGVRESQVFVGVGSDDVLAMCFLTFFGSQQPILFPDVTYSFYPVWAECFRIPYTKVPLDAAFGIRPDDYGIPCGGIIFPNPNAPTGRALSIGEVERIVAAHPEVIVIVDEAYVDFGTESALVLLPKYENLLVVQTFSKSRAMAGMRIGYAVGAEKVIKALSDVKYSFNSYTMNRTAILAGAAAAKDAEWFRETCEKIVATREWAGAELARLGFRFPESKANFLFVTHPRMDAAEIFAKLRERHIYVRYFDAPRTRDYLRITIGTREQMQTLLKALEEILR